MSQLTSVAVDIGSGITKVMANGQRAHFPSLSGPPVKGGFTIREDKEAFVEFSGKIFCVGERAFNMVRPGDVVDSTTDQWFEKDAYRALFYAALGRVLAPNFDGRITLCTGLPVGFYDKAKEKLINKLTGEHKFRINGHHYRVSIRRPNLYVVPQAVGLYFWALDAVPSLEHKRCGFIDVGTYTTGWVMIERFDVLAWAAGGARIGVSNLKARLTEYLAETYRMNCTRSVIEAALISQHIEVGGNHVRLDDAIDGFAMSESTRLRKGLDKSWGASKEADIFVGGGGGALFFPAVRTVYPHAQMLSSETPIYSVVEGYWKWLEQKMKLRSSVA